MLAIDGGAKVRSTLFPRRRLFGKEEKQAAMALFDAAIAAGEAFRTGAIRRPRMSSKPSAR